MKRVVALFIAVIIVSIFPVTINALSITDDMSLLVKCNGDDVRDYIITLRGNVRRAIATTSGDPDATEVYARAEVHFTYNGSPEYLSTWNSSITSDVTAICTIDSIYLPSTGFSSYHSVTLLVKSGNHQYEYHVYDRLSGSAD